MPEEALPIPHNPALRSLRPVRREYRDLLQRPFSGSLTLSGEEDHREGGTVVSSAPVKVSVVAGVLALDLPPGAYALRGQLWNADEEQMQVEEDFEC